jgi:hypothetical protein
MEGGQGGKMTNKHYGLISLAILAVISIINCGGGGGAPGSTGSNETGILIQSANLTVASSDIDTLRDCCAVDPLTGACTSLEIFTKDNAILNVLTSNLTPEITSANFPASLEQCTITYLKSNDDPAAPIIEDLTIYPNCELIEGANTCAVTLIDIARKLQYSTPVFITGTSSPANRPTHYVAKFSCSYVNNFGKAGHFETEIDLWLSDFDHC